ncbi:Uma2 family endonuclease [Floridanema evergladense]|uniref:Uma2 family endonuclease n=1 Tax=Floridaenema evergladense BLCC-F167 TaxID=3153639 RepID=A0ABV4WQV0_9CYAN
MTLGTSIVKPVSQIQLSPGSVVTIPNVNWQEFEAILQEMGEKRSSRIAYSKGWLEIMVPLPEHEKPKELISDMVKILLKKSGRKYEPFGSTTFKKENVAGVEPDACFYIQNYQRMINRRRLQPNDPPPDLAIESNVTSKTTLDAYEAIAVPELWVYANSKLIIYLLTNGQYIASETSPNFPSIPLTQIIPQIVELSWQVGTVEALAEFEKIIAEISF